MRKFSTEYVKEYFESCGYTLVGKYVRSRDPIETRCPIGHVCYIVFDNFKNKQCRCLTCYKESLKGEGNPFYGKHFSEESKRKLSEAHTGKRHTDKTRQLLSKKNKGKNNAFYGKKHTEEARSRISIAQKNRPPASIETRKKISEAQKGKIISEEQRQKISVANSGEGHPNWRGGISCEPYCQVWSDKEYKESIKQRDKYMCQNPYCSKQDNIICIHHIDYDKKNCVPGNLITVCRSCNVKANFDREWHTAWYQTIMNHRYGYKYK